MIDTQTISFLAILIESIGILLVPKRLVLLLGLATIPPIILFFII